MKRKKLYFILLLCGLFLLGGQMPGLAEEDNGLGYTVSLVQPATQIDPTKSYFYIETKAGEAQTLEARIKSTRKEAVNVRIFSANAITGDEGTIEYSSEPGDVSSTLTEPITSMVTIEPAEVTVGNYEEKTVRIQLVPPKESYEGVKMGALIFALEQEEEAASGVLTKFSYKIGLITSESGELFNDGEELQLTAAKAAIKRGKKMVLGTLQNPEPKVLENLTIEAVMLKKDTDEVVKTKSVENYRMAPNSQFDFELDWGLGNLPSGTYLLNLAVSNGVNEWQLSKELTITNQQAKAINQESAFQLVTPMWVKIVAVGISIASVLLFLVIVLRRRQWTVQWQKLRLDRKKKREKKRKRQKKGRGRKERGDVL